MEVITIDSKAYQDLINRLDKLSAEILEKQNGMSKKFIDNQEFLLLMNISKRTAQNWRDNQIIAFSQVGHKIYYKLSDVEELINRYKITASKPLKK